MANVGTIQEFKGPFSANTPLEISGHCRIGISISEDDFMSWLGGQDFAFEINGKRIHMGRTYIYETENQINNTVISFPEGAPLSTIVDVVYLEENE